MAFIEDGYEPINIKRVVAQLQRKINKNHEDRIKYPDEPEKWVQSEVELDEEIKKCGLLATSPDLYPEFITLGGIRSIVGLLSHSNMDIGIEVLDLLSDLTDPEIVQDIPAPEKFIDSLMESQFPELCIDIVIKINEEESKENYQAVSNALQIFENLSDLKPSVCVRYSHVQKFVPWLLRRIRQGNKADYNRIFGSEILGVLLQNAPDCREIFAAKGVEGIDKLLRTIAVYRKRDPANSDEAELVQNIFDCLCSLMLLPVHQLTFGQAQGLELMIRMMKERKFSCRLALKLSNFSLNNCPKNCDIFVEKYGLRQIFPLFMHNGLKLKSGSSAETEHDEHCVSIIQSLCRLCSGNSILRILNKFVENNFEKLERLVELHQYYTSRISMAPGLARDAVEINETFSIDSSEQSYLNRCEYGLFTLQMVDCIIVRLTNMGNRRLTDRLHLLLRTKGIPLTEIVSIVNEYRGSLGPSASDENSSMKLLTDCFARSETTA